MLDVILLSAGLASLAPHAPQHGPRAAGPPARSAPAALRSPVRIAEDAGRSYDVGSGGDRSVVLFADAGLPSRTKVRVSDGRGLRWSEPVDLDGDPDLLLGAGVDGIQILGQRIYLVWREYLSSLEGELYFARSEDGGSTWSTPVWLDKGFPRGVGFAVDFQLAACADPAGDQLQVLVRTWPPGLAGEEELFLVASNDGGASFGAAQPVSSVSGKGFDVDEARLAVDGMRVQVVWTDDRESPTLGYPDVYQRESADGGTTWLAPERRLSRGLADTACLEPRIALSGDDVVVLWLEPEASGAPVRVRVAVSEDGGGSFSPDVEIGAFPAGFRATTVDVRADGGLFLAVWTRLSTSGTQAFVEASRSLDGGTSWDAALPLPIAAQGARRVRVVGDGEDVGVGVVNDRAVVSTAFSTDLGLSWRQGAAGIPTPFLTRVSPLAFDPRYRNYIRLRQIEEDGREPLVVDGFRPQTVQLVAAPGASNESLFALEGFTGEFPQVFVLASGSAGDFPLPTDDRNLGLHFDPLLRATLHGVDGFDTTLDPTGLGATRPRSFAFLAGHTLTFVAAAFDPNHFAFGSLTDAVELRLP